MLNSTMRTMWWVLEDREVRLRILVWPDPFVEQHLEQAMSFFLRELIRRTPELQLTLGPRD